MQTGLRKLYWSGYKLDKNPRYWYVYGAGGLGRETMDIIIHMTKQSDTQPVIPVFVEDNTSKKKCMDIPVIDLTECETGAWVTIAVGEPKLRVQLKEKALSKGLILRSAISPSAVISHTACIGAGSIIAPFCSIQSNATVGSNVAINTMAIIGHDVDIGNNAVISSMVNLGGSTHVADRTYIGMGALIKEGLKIGERTIISMGSVVFRDIPERVIAVGNPARVAKRNENEKVFK